MSTATDARPQYATVASLHIYPVKSCAGIALDTARLSITGLEHDRRWMLIDAQRRFVSQREQPRLALIQPTLLTAGLQLDAPGHASLQIHCSDQRVQSVTIWRDQCDAFDEGDEAASWLSEFLHASVRLVRFDDARSRPSNREWTGDVVALNHFSDGYPLLVISQASLDDLNARLPAPVPMNRFRPNLVISGVHAYAEDEMAELHAEGSWLRIVKPCTRCQITTTDQTTGSVMGGEPLATLRQYRRSLELKGVLFGQNAIAVTGIGTTLRVGQALAAHWRHSINSEQR